MTDTAIGYKVSDFGIIVKRFGYKISVFGMADTAIDYKDGAFRDDRLVVAFYS